jgi:hypothetical protein
MDAACLPYSPQEIQFFLLLGEVLPFCILRQNDPANEARKRPCSISRAEKFESWPKFFATFQQYSCHSLRGLSFRGFKLAGSSPTSLNWHREPHASPRRVFPRRALFFLRFPSHILGRTMIWANIWLCSRRPNPQLPWMAFLPERPFRHYINAAHVFWHLPLPRTQARSESIRNQGGSAVRCFLSNRTSPVTMA